MSRKVLVIGLSWEQQPLIDRMLEHGWKLYGFHQNDSFGVSRARELNDCFQQIQLGDLRDLASMTAFAKQIKPESVVSDQCDYSHFAQSLVATNCNLPGPSLEAAQISSNKYLQRLQCKKQNIDVPEFRWCSNWNEVHTAAHSLGFPVIVKPTDNRGSFGVNRVDSDTGLEAAFLDAIAHSHSRTVLVEEFVEGIHITVDGYAFPELGCKSLALATKGLLPNTSNQVAVDIIYPGELASSLYDKAMTINEDVNRKLGYQFGMTHSEYMVTDDDRIVLIESANRGGGCFTSQLIVPNVSGVNLVDQLLSDIQGHSTCHYATPNRTPTILKFVSFPGGEIDSIDGMDKVQSDEHVLAARLAVEPGSVIQPVSNDANRHGFVIYSDREKTNPEQLRKAAKLTLDRIEITYKKTGSESLVA